MNMLFFHGARQGNQRAQQRHLLCPRPRQKELSNASHQTSQARCPRKSNTKSARVNWRGRNSRGGRLSELAKTPIAVVACSHRRVTRTCLVRFVRAPMCVCQTSLSQRCMHNTCKFGSAPQASLYHRGAYTKSFVLT